MEASGVFCLWGWSVLLDTPLCPAGHLPLKGGDRQEALPTLHWQLLRWVKPDRESISPPEGEMSGRTEGGKPLCTLNAHYLAAVSAPSGAALLSTCTTTDIPGDSSAASG